MTGRLLCSLTRGTGRQSVLDPYLWYQPPTPNLPHGLGRRVRLILFSVASNELTDRNPRPSAIAGGKEAARRPSGDPRDLLGSWRHSRAFLPLQARIRVQRKPTPRRSVVAALGGRRTRCLIFEVSSRGTASTVQCSLWHLAGYREPDIIIVFSVAVHGRSSGRRHERFFWHQLQDTGNIAP